jgi:hypothetical protein
MLILVIERARFVNMKYIVKIALEDVYFKFKLNKRTKE